MYTELRNLFVAKCEIPVLSLKKNVSVLGDFLWLGQPMEGLSLDFLK